MTDTNYREGHDDDAPEQEPVISGTNVVQDFVPKNTAAPPKDMEGEACITAVLVILKANGEVVPYNHIEGLERHHDATPHEMFRMCADVQNQISNIRTAGEVLQTVDKMFAHQTQVLENNSVQRSSQLSKFILNLFNSKK